MPGPDKPRLPQLEPHDYRRQAEDFLGLGDTDVDVPRAIAFGVLAVAAELHAIRGLLRKR